MQNMYEIMRMKDVAKMAGVSNATLYRWVKRGLLTPPVKRVGKNPGWPVYEIERFNSARIAGWTEDEIKVLAREFMSLRRAGRNAL